MSFLVLKLKFLIRTNSVFSFLWLNWLCWFFCIPLLSTFICKHARFCFMEYMWLLGDFLNWLLLDPRILLCSCTALAMSDKGSSLILVHLMQFSYEYVQCALCSTGRRGAWTPAQRTGVDPSGSPSVWSPSPHRLARARTLCPVHWPRAHTALHLGVSSKS